MALSWVHENIRAFGGDPDKVTMYGESSGSSSVFLQSVSVGRATFSTFKDFDFNYDFDSLSLLVWFIGPSLKVVAILDQVENPQEMSQFCFIKHPGIAKLVNVQVWLTTHEVSRELGRWGENWQSH